MTALTSGFLAHPRVRFAGAAVLAGFMATPALGGAARAQQSADLEAAEAQRLTPPEGCRALASLVHKDCEVRHLLQCGADPRARVEYVFRDGALQAVQRFASDFDLGRYMNVTAVEAAAALTAPPEMTAGQADYQFLAGAPLGAVAEADPPLSAFRRVYRVASRETAAGGGDDGDPGGERVYFFAEHYRETGVATLLGSERLGPVRLFEYRWLEVGAAWSVLSAQRGQLAYAPALGAVLGWDMTPGDVYDYTPVSVILPGEPGFLALEPRETCR